MSTQRDRWNIRQTLVSRSQVVGKHDIRAPAAEVEAALTMDTGADAWGHMPPINNIATTPPVTHPRGRR